jgi:hypothetical protein
MAIDTLAYAKHLEAAGVQREAGEAYAEALMGHILPDLATKAGLEQLKHDLTVRVFGLVLGIVSAVNGILFALLRIIH